jgi:CHAT domain-containing protein
LKKKAAEFRRQLASQDLGFAPLSQELYRMLVAPAAAVLAHYPDWIVVPEDSLWDVPFQALQSRPGRFLIEDSAISYTPSLTVLRATLRNKPNTGNREPGYDLFAVGNPSIRSAEGLPEAEKQVLALQKVYGETRSRVLTGSAATEERFKAEAGRYTVVHLATHAILDNASPMYSRVLLASASAGSREDGFLEAREMMDLNLRAEMVVLSGCETASGQAAGGEGVTGMLWAMFVAGVPTTVASLWPVESASTSVLMVEFHRQWLASRQKAGSFHKAAALRAAALKLIATREYAHPFYWAAFLVAGNPN